MESSNYERSLVLVVALNSHGDTLVTGLMQTLCVYIQTYKEVRGRLVYLNIEQWRLTQYKTGEADSGALLLF